MDVYNLQKAANRFAKFIDDLTNWYIRRSRRRFWKSQNDSDKLYAYRTLRYVLVQLSKVAAPFTPFIAEEIYRNLRGKNDPLSVHLCDFPAANASARQSELEKSMAAVMTVVELGRRLRADNDLKVRQPLAVIKVAGADVEGLKELVLDELNIKNLEQIADERSLCDVSYKANFKTLGRKCGPKMKSVAAAIAEMSGEDLGPAWTKRIEGVEITAQDVLVTRSPKQGLVVASEGEIVVGLDTTLDETLISEGLAREFVSHVQSMRKEADFEVVQRIIIRVETDDEMKDAIMRHIDYVKNETLALEVLFEHVAEGETQLNSHTAKIEVERK